MQPGQALLREYVPRRMKLRGITKCSDMEMSFIRQLLALAGQRRPAVGTKSPPPAGRRIELGYLTFGNDIRVALKCHEDRDRRTAMLAATFAMAPHYRFRLTGGYEAHSAAQAASLELIAHAAEHNASKLALHGNRSPANPPVFLWLDSPQAPGAPARFERRRPATIGDRPLPPKGNGSARVYH